LNSPYTFNWFVSRTNQHHKTSENSFGQLTNGDYSVCFTSFNPLKGLALYIEPTQHFSPGSVNIHSIGLRKQVNIYQFILNFWAVKADIEKEGGLSVSLFNVGRKAKSPIFYYRAILCRLNIIFTNHCFRTSLWLERRNFYPCWFFLL